MGSVLWLSLRSLLLIVRPSLSSLEIFVSLQACPDGIIDDLLCQRLVAVVNINLPNGSSGTHVSQIAREFIAAIDEGAFLQLVLSINPKTSFVLVSGGRLILSPTSEHPCDFLSNVSTIKPGKDPSHFPSAIFSESPTQPPQSNAAITDTDTLTSSRSGRIETAHFILCTFLIGASFLFNAL